VRVAFDSRPVADPRGVGSYAHCLLRALRATASAHDEIRETHRPRGVDVFHAPWMQGAMLHSPCPMIVTLQDLAPLKRPSERLRGGGMHLRLRHLAVQRAMRVIVPSEAVAGEAVAELGLERERVVVIPEASDPGTFTARQPTLAPPSPSWSWEDAADATWSVYEQAIAQALGARSAGRGGLRRRPQGRPSTSA
jgi:hypothetical protein